MNAISRSALGLLLAGTTALAHAQPASAPVTTPARPAATTPPNTVPYTPAQADKPDTSKPVPGGVRSAARKERAEAMKTCNSEKDKQVKKDCTAKASAAYNKAITP